MCGRFTLTVPSYEDLAATLGVQAGVWAAPLGGPLAEVGASYRPRYNIAPTDPAWVVRMSLGIRELVSANWGLIPRWSKTPMQAGRPINARAESLTSKPMFREAFERRRCLVVADGFFEWEKIGKQRNPLWFQPSSGGLLLMGGLWDEWGDRETGRVVRSFSIVTTSANEDVSFLHDRMPIMLGDEASIATWLSVPANEDDGGAITDNVRALLRPAPAGSLQAKRVSRRVNSVKNDDPSVLEPPEVDEKESGTLPLFAPAPSPSKARSRARR